MNKVIKISTSFALTTSSGLVVNGVVGGGITGAGAGGLNGSAIIQLLIRQLILRQIIHTHALPHRIHLDAHAKQHDLAGTVLAGGDRSLGAARHHSTEVLDCLFECKVRCNNSIEIEGVCICVCIYRCVV